MSTKTFLAVSGQEETTVRAALTELVRREVLSVSADPLSPERGSYRFAQNMLRQEWLEADHDPEGGLAPYTAAALEDLRAASASLS